MMAIIHPEIYTATVNRACDEIGSNIANGYYGSAATFLPFALDIWDTIKASVETTLPELKEYSEELTDHVVNHRALGLVLNREGA